MVTKYDVFLYLADRNTAIKAPEAVRYFKKKKYEYPNFYRLLRNLVEDGLATRTVKGFEIKLSPKSRLLYSAITYCTSNNINYNYLLDRKFVQFISKALKRVEFGSRDFDLNPKTFKKYTDTLQQYGLIILISRKPFKARIAWNYLLNTLLQYYDIFPQAKRRKKIDFLLEIEKELKIFNKKVRKNEQAYNALVQELELTFVHSSLFLEGNPITLPNTIKILKDHIIPKDLKDSDVKEVQNYRKALDTMMKDAVNGNLLTKEKILNYHFIAMQHKEQIAGKMRTIPVHIKGNPKFKIAAERRITALLNELIENYETFTSKKNGIKEILKFAAYFHNQFQYIHPFRDGNSRVTRLITFHLLQYQKIPIFDIPIVVLDEYLSNTKGYDKRDDNQLFQTLQLVVLYNLKTINAKIM